MGSLRDKYGGKFPQAINRAIRAEMVGGDDLLDALNLADRLCSRLKERDLAGIDEAFAAKAALLRLKDLMVEILKARYQ